MPLKNELAKTSIRASVTDSASIGSYTEFSVDTNLAITGQHIFVVTGIYFKHNVNLNGNARTCDLVVAYSAQAGIIGPGDSDFMFGASWLAGQVTSGSLVSENITYQQIDHFPIATQQLFFGLQTANVTPATTGELKIMGYHTKVTSQDFFRLAQSR